MSSSNSAIEPDWLRHAQLHLGTKEWAGAKHNPKIVSYFARAGFAGIKDDETPWCAAFVNAVFAECGLPTTGKLTARSFLKWGAPIEVSKRGSVAVFRRGQSSWQGHVGFVVGADSTHLTLLGGNQSNTVSIARYRRSKLLGLRWPSAV